MESVVFKISWRGKSVILGHGIQLVLRDFGYALHVLVYASEPFRVQNLAEQRDLKKGAAKKMIRKCDNEWRGFHRFAFHMDWQILY